MSECLYELGPLCWESEDKVWGWILLQGLIWGLVILNILRVKRSSGN